MASALCCSTICNMPLHFTSIFVCQATSNHLRCHVTPQESGLHKPLHVHAAAPVFVMLCPHADKVERQVSGSNINL